MLLAALIYLKPKVHNVATISAFALFFVTCIHLWTVNWLYSPFLILLSGDVEINPYPYLDSSVAPDDDNLEISGYSLVRSDHPSNNKRGGVCVYYKMFLPL